MGGPFYFISLYNGRFLHIFSFNVTDKTDKNDQSRIEKKNTKITTMRHKLIYITRSETPRR